MQVKKTCLAVIVATALLSSGCASVENKDPLEGFNRAVYKFNDTADKAVLKPVAGAYKAVLPSPIRSGVGNFFANLSTFVSAINNVLQFKFSDAFDDAGRFVINTTFGVAGVMDLASMDGVAKHNEDFGQTLGHWGLGDGAYLVLPFLGPSTLRDTAGLAVDASLFMPVLYLDDTRTRNQLLITQFVDTRAQLLPGSDLLDEAALDPYAFMRDAYLQRRHHQIQDGEAKPVDSEFEESNSNVEMSPVALQEKSQQETQAQIDTPENQEIASQELTEASKQETTQQTFVTSEVQATETLSATEIDTAVLEAPKTEEANHSDANMVEIVAVEAQSAEVISESLVQEVTAQEPTLAEVKETLADQSTTNVSTEAIQATPAVEMDAEKTELVQTNEQPIETPAVELTKDASVTPAPQAIADIPLNQATNDVIEVETATPATQASNVEEAVLVVSDTNLNTTPTTIEVKAEVQEQASPAATLPMELPEDLKNASLY